MKGWRTLLTHDTLSFKKPSVQDEKHQVTNDAHDQNNTHMVEKNERSLSLHVSFIPAEALPPSPMSIA